MPGAGYQRPSSPDEVTALLSTPGARALAGGTDLLVELRREDPGSVLVDLNAVPGLDEITRTADGGLSIGAIVRMSRLETDPAVRSYPLLAEAAATVGSIQIRNRATLAGNICNASPAADTAPALLCYEAVVCLAGPGGRRVVPIEGFWTGPRRTVLQPGEWVEAVALPPSRPHGGCYLKLGRRLGVDLAVVGVAALAAADGPRFAASAVAPTPVRLRSVEAVIASAPPGPLPDLEPAVGAAISPIDDIRAGADYRRAMAAVLARRAWETALARFAEAGRSRP